MFVSDVSDFSFVGKVEPYFLSAGEEVISSILIFSRYCYLEMIYIKLGVLLRHLKTFILI